MDKESAKKRWILQGINVEYILGHSFVVFKS